MILLALAIDPIIRCLNAESIGPSSCLVGHADDLLFLFDNVVRRLAPLAAAFQAVEESAGHWLKTKKCNLLLIGGAKVSQLRRFIEVHIPFWKEMRFVDYM